MAEVPPPEFIAFIETELFPARDPKVLEIGGGAATYIELHNARYTVVDVSGDALSRCRYAEETLVADAQIFEPEQQGFDVVVFWNVLEHIEDPSAALGKAAKAVRPKGLLIARGPELRSLKALITRMTPHWMHVAFYKKVLGLREAGEPGRSPFPVEHSPGASAEAIMATLLPLGFRVAYDQRYVGDQLQLLREYSRFAYFLYRFASVFLCLLTRRRWGGRPTDFVLAFRKLA